MQIETTTVAEDKFLSIPNDVYYKHFTVRQLSVLSQTSREMRVKFSQLLNTTYRQHYPLIFANTTTQECFQLLTLIKKNFKIDDQQLIAELNFVYPSIACEKPTFAPTFGLFNRKLNSKPFEILRDFYQGKLYSAWQPFLSIYAIYHHYGTYNDDGCITQALNVMTEVHQLFSNTTLKKLLDSMGQQWRCAALPMLVLSGYLGYLEYRRAILTPNEDSTLILQLDQLVHCEDELEKQATYYTHLMVKLIQLLDGEDCVDVKNKINQLQPTHQATFDQFIDWLAFPQYTAMLEADRQPRCI